MKMLPALVAVAAVLIAAAPADAYRLGGKKWPTRTITYHSSVPQYEEAIATAARAWNRSGVAIRFKRVNRARDAALKIVQAHGPGRRGSATKGWTSARTVVKRAGGRRYRGPHMWLHDLPADKLAQPYHRNWMTITAAHEFGHVLGLLHVKNKCAVMSYQRERACPKPKNPWELRCRPVERDDVRGAIHRYGGRKRKLAPPLCNAYEPLPAPVGLVAAAAGPGRMNITWTHAPAPGFYKSVVAVNAGRCSKEGAWGFPGTPGTPASSAPALPAGRYCVLGWTIDAQLRPGPTTPPVWVDIPG